jgi:hypothetical protein
LYAAQSTATTAATIRRQRHIVGCQG